MGGGRYIRSVNPTRSSLCCRDTQLSPKTSVGQGPFAGFTRLWDDSHHHFWGASWKSNKGVKGRGVGGLEACAHGAVRLCPNAGNSPPPLPSRREPRSASRSPLSTDARGVRPIPGVWPVAKGQNGDARWPSEPPFSPPSCQIFVRVLWLHVSSAFPRSLVRCL